MKLKSLFCQLIHRDVRRVPAVCGSVVLTVLLLTTMVPAGAARLDGAESERQQVVIGRVALPSRALAKARIESCDPRVQNGVDEARREVKAENGGVGYWFEVDARTRGEGFALEATGGMGAVNLDIAFISPALTGWTTATEGGERGQVPPDADWALVCLTEGLNATFRYTAGSSVQPVHAREEASWSDHSANIRLLGRGFTSDGPRRLAFQGRHAIAASRDGINIFRLHEDAPYIEHLSYYECGAGASADISVWGNYVFQSIPNEYPYFSTVPTTEYNDSRSRHCNNTDESEGKAGIRVIDISDPRRPRQVKFFETPCGAMNHTLLPHRGALYIYAPIPCDEDTEVPIPGHEIRPVNFQIRVMRFDPEHPRRSRWVGTPPLENQLGCHDITVFPSRDLAACPQFFNEVLRTALLDISDPLNPRVIKHLPLPKESTWMSYATFTWDGRFLVVADTDMTDYTMDQATDCEGGNDKRGALWIYDVGDPEEASLIGHYVLPRVSTSIDHECAPTEVSMIPSRDRHRHVAVVGWNGGGLTVVDLSAPTAPKEIAHWVPPAESEIKGSYFYNGRLYSVEYWSGSGIRVFDLAGFGRGETSSYAARMNPQTQLLEFRK